MTGGVPHPNMQPCQASGTSPSGQLPGTLTVHRLGLRFGWSCFELGQLGQLGHR